MSSAGWWVAIVVAVAAAAPYIGGSQDNSILELTLGYNGFGRLTGDEVRLGRRRCGARHLGRDRDRPAAVRLEIGGQSAGCCPPRCCCSAWPVVTRRPRHRLVARGLVLWGGLVVTARRSASWPDLPRLLHGALRPAIGALVGTGCVAALGATDSLARLGKVGQRGGALTTVMSFFLLGRTTTTSCRGCGGWCSLSAWSSRWPVAGSAGCRRGSRWLAAAALVVSAGRPRGVRRRRPRPRRTPARSRAPVRPGRRGPGSGGGTGGGRGACPPEAAPGGLLAAASPPTITALLQRTLTSTRGWPRRSAPTRLPATSWPARSR
jgi:hypothetical protein